MIQSTQGGHPCEPMKTTERKTTVFGGEELPQREKSKLQARLAPVRDNTEIC